MRHAFRAIPGFPDYEISNTGWVLSLPRTVNNRWGPKQFFPGAILNPWLNNHKPAVTMHDAEGRRHHLNLSVLLRKVWKVRIDEARRIARENFEGKGERPKPVTIWRGNPVPLGEFRRLAA